MGATVAGIGFGLSAYGQYQAGQMNRDLMRYNAQVAEYQSEDALVRGEIKEQRFRRDAAKFIGSQKVALAAQGIEIDDDSALDVMANTAYLAEVDALTIRNNAKREAWGYKVQAEDYRFRGEIEAFEGTYGAIGTLGNVALLGV